MRSILPALALIGFTVGTADEGHRRSAADEGHKHGASDLEYALGATGEFVWGAFDAAQGATGVVPGAFDAAQGATGFVRGAAEARAVRIASAASGPRRSDSTEIVEQSRAFSAAYERGDVDAMMDIYSDDAVILPGNVEAIQGREALRAYWALAPGRRITHHEATPEAIRVEGDLASDYGVYDIAGINGGESWGPFRGKYLIVWERHPDGKWRMELDMWNARSREAQPEIDCVRLAGESVIHQACIEEVNLSRHFEGMEGTFVLYDADAGSARVHGRSRARERLLPASTFKIPNSVIALEEGVSTGADFEMPWDSVAVPPQDFWPDSWRGDQTMRSALRNSVVWYYQELARRIGEEPMQRWLDRFDYGNRDLGGSIDRFWLRGPLSISAFEQVAFLDRFQKNDLGVSDRTTQIVKEMLVLEEGDGFVLSGKTGTADVTPTRELGWLVGYVEVDDGVYVYALNVEGERVWEDWPPQRRAETVKTLLRELGAIPAAAE